MSPETADDLQIVVEAQTTEIRRLKTSLQNLRKTHARQKIEFLEQLLDKKRLNIWKRGKAGLLRKKGPLIGLKRSYTENRVNTIVLLRNRGSNLRG